MWLSVLWSYFDIHLFISWDLFLVVALLVLHKLETVKQLNNILYSFSGPNERKYRLEYTRKVHVNLS